MENVDTYRLQVICTNCGEKQALNIKKGREFHGKSTSRFGSCITGNNNEFVKCEYCGCGTLIKL